MKLLLQHKKTIGSLLIVALVLGARFAFAQNTIGDLADNVTETFGSLGKLMIAAAYIGGFALVIAAIFKFKQHKDNPTQIPLGTPIALLIIGVILVFLPTLFGTAGETIFGGDQEIGGFGGEGADVVGGGGGGAGGGV